MADDSKTSGMRSRLRYSLAALLLVVACLAAIFGGFRLGYVRGYSAGQEQPTAESYYPVIYPVGDIADLDGGGQPDFDYLRDVITLIDPDTWDDVGAPGQIRIDHANEAFVILQAAAVHQTIQRIVQAIRDGRKAPLDAAGD